MLGGPNRLSNLSAIFKTRLLGRDDYFLGNLVVIKRGREDEFEVIDGQQRLTTLYLLLTFTEQDGEGGKPSIGHAGHLQYESRARATEALRRVAQEAAKGTSDRRAPRVMQMLASMKATASSISSSNKMKPLIAHAKNSPISC